MARRGSSNRPAVVSSSKYTGNRQQNQGTSRLPISAIGRPRQLRSSSTILVKKSSSSKSKDPEYSCSFHRTTRKQCGVSRLLDAGSTPMRMPTSPCGKGLSGPYGPFHSGGQLGRPRHVMRGWFLSSINELRQRENTTARRSAQRSTQPKE